MRPLRTALLLACLCSSPAWGAEPTLDQLVPQLGNPSFKERDKATKALRTHGLKAVPALQKAATSPDLEIRARALQLLDEINPQQEAALVLAPRKVRLAYKNIPIPDALADFAKQTGFEFTLDPAERERLAQKRITLETSELTAWEALAKLCTTCGVYEVPYDIPAEKPLFPFLDDQEMRGRRRRVVWVDSYRDNGPVLLGHQMTLRAGTAHAPPTVYAGGLRIQAIEAAKNKPLVPSDQVALALVFATESRVRWHHVEYVRIDGAVDCIGQKLKPDISYVRDVKVPESREGELVLMWDGSGPWPLQPPLTRHAFVRLNLPARKAPMLREVRGVVGAEVETPPELLVELDGLFKSAGKVFFAKDGTKVCLLEAELDRDNCYRLKVTVERPLVLPEALVGPGIRVAPIRRRRGEQDVTPTTISRPELEHHGLALRDSKGELVPLVTGEVTPCGPGDKREFLLYFHPLKGQSSPMKLQVSGRRTTLIEVPFTLTDVPLP